MQPCNSSDCDEEQDESPIAFVPDDVPNLMMCSPSLSLSLNDTDNIVIDNETVSCLTADNETSIPCSYRTTKPRKSSINGNKKLSKSKALFIHPQNISTKPQAKYTAANKNTAEKLQQKEKT